METAYITDFQKFLEHTDEKEVLLNEIGEELKRNNCSSLLDIGAGNGLLAVPLSKKVKKYVAIEPKEKYVDVLKHAGLNVIRSLYPIKMSEKFDAVLFSHIFSFNHPNYREFITPAWECLNLNGVIIIVTYRGADDDWTRLLESIGEKKADSYKNVYAEMNDYLSSLGELSSRTVVSTVQTDNVNEMIGALSFVYSNGALKKKELFLSQREPLEKFLEKYKKSDGYIFPLQHFILTARKA
jgi:SAM-dependent methyltransferase